VDNRPDVRRMLWGVALILGGTLLLCERFGLLPDWAADYQWWGALVVVAGVVTLLVARHSDTVGTGVTFILLGWWFLVVTNHLFGLTWYNSWPLALVAAGAGTVAHAIASNWLPDKERPRHRRRRREQLDEPAEERHA